jgi:positive regulator of sigma E activity
VSPAHATLESGARRPHVAAAVVGVVDGGVLVRTSSACAACRGSCGMRAVGGDGCTLRVAVAAGRAVPVPGSMVALAASATELSRCARELYGVPLAGMLAGAVGAGLLGGGEAAVALGAAGGLAAALTCLRLRPPRPPAFELIEDERT